MMRANNMTPAANKTLEQDESQHPTSQDHPSPADHVNIAELCLDRHVNSGNGDRLALKWIDRRRETQCYTYAQLAEKAARVAAMLSDLGVMPGDVVAVLLPKLPELAFIALGCWKIGAVFNPMFASFGPAPIGSRLELGHARLLITTPDLYTHRVHAHRPHLADLNTVLLVGEDVDARNVGGTQSFDALMASANTQNRATVLTLRATPAFLHFTSGTTGTPKGTLHSHGSALAHLASVQTLFSLSPDDVYWCTADPGWVPATAYGLIAPLAVGCVTVMDSQDFDAQRWYSILANEQVTVWYTTPTWIRMMMRFGAAMARSYRKIALRVAASGGEPLNAEAVAWGTRALGVPFMDSWWQTETGAIVIANQPDHYKPGSMGKPLPGVECQIFRRDAEILTPVTQENEVGELALRAELPSMFIGYTGDQTAYSRCFKDGWYMTGDQVRRDGDGYLWFVGRCDDMIKSAGQFIGPFEVENALLDHPAVADTGVVGKPDALLREIPVAYVVLNPGFEPCESLRFELLTFARQSLGAMSPREIHFIDALPKTATGSIRRCDLRNKIQARSAEDAPLPPRCAFPNDY